MPVRQKLPAAKAALFNAFGRGVVFMGYFDVEEPEPTPQQQQLARRLLMGAALATRSVKGVLSSPTIAAAGTGADFQAADGLDLTLDQDGETVTLAFSVYASFSASPAVFRAAVKLDGNQITDQQLAYPYTGTTLMPFAGHFALNVGPGSHRYQLVVTSDSAITITLTGQARSMTVTGIRATD